MGLDAINGLATRMKHLAGGMEAARSDLLQNYQIAPEAWLNSADMLEYAIRPYVL